MRYLILLAVVAGADDPKPGTIVVRPKGTAIVQRTPDPVPDRDGFIVIRPRGTPTGFTTPRQLSADPPTPTRAAPPTGDPVPTPTPMPVPVPPRADEPKADAAPGKGKLVLETWDTAYLKGQKVGYFRVVVREDIKNGTTYHYATKEMRLTVARFGQIVEQWAEDATLESPDGKVLVTRMRQGLNKDQVLALVGTVNGNKLAVKGEGSAEAARDVPWSDGVLGVAKEATLFADKKPKPGDVVEYSYYEGRLNKVVKVSVTAKALETVALIEGQPPRKTLRLLAEQEPIRDENGRVVLPIPPATIWCDADTFEVLRMDQDNPPLGGRMVVLRTTKEVALRPPGKVPDLFDVQSIRLDREVPGVHDKAAVVYRVKVEGDGDPNPSDAFPQDARQAVKNVAADGRSFELHVAAVRGPGDVVGGEKPGPAYLSHSFFIDWQDPAVAKRVEALRATIPTGASDWDKALAVEAWVHRNMKAVEFSQAMATASQVAKTLGGDCTEYAMLATGLCRAVGVPARTALGLVYAPGPGGRPYLAYHMWFEVYAGGRWVALDATLGRGGVGPGHIKITDAHWENERSFTPLLPVLRVLMSAPKVEVVSAR